MSPVLFDAQVDAPPHVTTKHIQKFKMWGLEDGSDSEADDEVEDLDKTVKPSFVAIAIDTHPLMFRKTEDDSSPFKNCLSACHVLADSLLLGTSSSFNQFAVLVAREESPCVTEFKDNLIETVKFLQSKSNLPNKQLAEEYQRKGDFDLAAFFLACKKVFHDIKTPFSRRTLIYITDDDEPVQNAMKRFTALNEVKTFNGNQIDFQLIQTTSEFDYSKFYNELFSLLDTPPMEEWCEDKEGLIEKLTSTVVTRQFQRKILFYPFRDDTSRFLNCYRFNVISEKHLSNKKVTKDGKLVKQTTGDQTLGAEYQIKPGVPGTETIKFDPYEKLNVIDDVLPMGLNLLYVSKRSTNIGYNFKKPFILQPQKKEDVYFEKFWECCVKNDRVLVCAMKQQLGKVRCVELIPNIANNCHVFLAKHIPFSNEIVLPREMDYPEPEPNNAQKEAIRKLVDALTFDFDLSMIPDPCYQKKAQYVKAKLLESKVELDDAPFFNMEALDDQLKEAVHAINSNFTFEEEKKRKRTNGSSKAKKTK